ncbi:unnamed protein product [Caenorhabditis auriculariae]|uniref:Uncharacterized protein n=1 Tax=Caenorhabditis auriculariae TaxID=2777116 RepID=A0A8S1HSB2_9PELO|nr:unnamed protein product [Caenorhabditis auriculariae]
MSAFITARNKGLEAKRGLRALAQDPLHSELVKAQLGGVRVEERGEGLSDHAFNLINYTLDYLFAKGRTQHPLHSELVKAQLDGLRAQGQDEGP